MWTSALSCLASLVPSIKGELVESVLGVGGVQTPLLAGHQAWTMPCRDPGAAIPLQQMPCPVR